MTENRGKKTDRHSRRLLAGFLILSVLFVCFYAAGCSLLSSSAGLAGRLRTVASGAGDRGAPLFGTGYELLQLTEEDMAEGTLVLVNGDNLWSFPEGQNLVSVYGGKTDSYYVKDMNVLLSGEIMQPLNDMMDAFRAETGFDDVNLVSGYRNYADQESLYDESLAENGEAHTARYTAQPGCSEHHTGLAFDLSLFYEDTGASGEFEGSAESGWFIENSWEYGFVQRYEPGKEAVTGIADEPWHYRYVGQPHAQVMHENGLCLEEYLEYLKSCAWNGEHLAAEYGGVSYELYYCSGTKVHVPENGDYTVSGDNAGGFIVTVEK